MQLHWTWNRRPTPHPRHPAAQAIGQLEPAGGTMAPIGIPDSTSTGSGGNRRHLSAGLRHPDMNAATHRRSAVDHPFDGSMFRRT
jgi:hypothetical protein